MLGGVGALLTAPRDLASIRLLDLGLGWWAALLASLATVALIVLEARAVGGDSSP